MQPSRTVNIKPPFKKEKPQFNVDPKIIQLVYRHYISSKILDTYCTVIKDRLPTPYLENKSNDVVRACEQFYRQFDKKIPISEELDKINDGMLDYFEMFDYMLSLNKEDFSELKDRIWKLIEMRAAENQMEIERNVKAPV